jgi:rubrerythrin
MHQELFQVLEEAIELELNVAELYLFFSYHFPEDNDFWWKLALEEKNHAALLKSGQQYFVEANLFPEEILSCKLDILIRINQKIKNFITKFQETPPCRETALQVALELEQSAGEVHFQTAMEILPTSKALEMFQYLNRDDKDHAARIQAYMQTRGL